MRMTTRHLRPLFGFGLPLAGASLIVFAVGFVDQVTVGHLLGPTQLGFYVLAYNLASWPVTLISQPTRSVAPALFARIQHDPTAMTSVFVKLLRPLAGLALPCCIAISAASAQIVELVYGHQWAPASTALRWLSLMAAMRILFELVYDYLVVLGRSQVILLVQLIWLVGLLPAVIGGVQVAGIEGAGLAQLAVAVCLVLPLYLWHLSRVGIRARGIWQAVQWATVASCALYGAVSMVARTPWGNLAVLAACGGIALMTLLPLGYQARHDLQLWKETRQG
jgi:PST family polysaccharide transporter